MDSGVSIGHPTGAARPPRPEVTVACPQHRHQREEAKRCELITSSQKEEDLGGPPSSRGGPDEDDPQNTEVLEYEDRESGGAEPVSLCEGNEKEELHRQVQGEEDPSGNGPVSKGNGRGCSGRSPAEESEPSERRASNSRSEGELLAEGGPEGNPTKWSGKRSEETSGQGKTGLGDPREPQMFQSGERQWYLNQGPPKEGLEPTPMITQFESPERPNNRRTSPGRRLATFPLLAPLVCRRPKKHPKRPAKWKNPTVG